MLAYLYSNKSNRIDINKIRSHYDSSKRRLLQDLLRINQSLSGFAKNQAYMKKITKSGLLGIHLSVHISEQVCGRIVTPEAYKGREIRP